jgi:hypothetical protein
MHIYNTIHVLIITFYLHVLGAFCVIFRKNISVCSKLLLHLVIVEIYFDLIQQAQWVATCQDYSTVGQ